MKATSSHQQQQISHHGTDPTLDWDGAKGGCLVTLKVIAMMYINESSN